MPTIFDPASLKRAIEDVLAPIPQGKRGALLGYWTTDGRWKVVVVHRVGESWDIGAVLQSDMGRISGGVQVRGTW